MSIHFHESRLALIGAVSERWPDRSTSLFWGAAHKLIAALVATARTADQEIDAIERNNDLAVSGKAKAIGDVALQALAKLDDLAEFRTMKSRAEADVAMFEKKKGSLPKVGTDGTDSAIAAQIRERISCQESPLNFAAQHKADPQVVAAIAAAPAFLSGLSDTEKAQFLREAEGVLWPDASARIRAIQEALHYAEKEILNVKKMVGERGQLMQTLGADGVRRWDLKSLANAA